LRDGGQREPVRANKVFRDASRPVVLCQLGVANIDRTAAKLGTILESSGRLMLEVIALQARESVHEGVTQRRLLDDRTSARAPLRTRSGGR
jgi:hypothetical protein